jgi:predicted nucleic acid-binding protein
MNPFLRKIKDQTVAVDSMIFIYAFEQHSTYLPFVKSFFQSLEKGDFRALTSTITIAECLVLPYRQKDYALAAQYLVLFRNFPHLSALAVTGEIAERAASLRAQHNLKTPDAIQLATALLSDARFFLTNDEALPSIEGIHTLLLSRMA